MGGGDFFPEPLGVDLIRAAAYRRAGVSLPKRLSGDRLELVQIRRQNKRRILNEEMLLAALQGNFSRKVGIFGIPNKGQILPRMEILEEKTAEAQVKLFSGVDILVSAHGAGLSNVIFMVPNSYVIELMPPYWDWACYRRLSENTDMQYRMIRSKGKKGPECDKHATSRLCREKGIRDRDFNADIDEVVDAVRSAIGKVFRKKYKVLDDFSLFCWK